MKCRIRSSDINYCRDSAKAVIAGNSVLPSEKLPGVEPALSKGPSNAMPKTMPILCTYISGSLTWGTNSFVLRLPDSSVRLNEFRKGHYTKAEFEEYVAALVMHELVHFRQFRDCRLGTPPPKMSVDTPSACLEYYGNKLEMEAHAAQIAYALGQHASRTTQNDIFNSTEVGKLMSYRLQSLTGTEKRQWQALRKKYVRLVDKSRKLLFPRNPKLHFLNQLFQRWLCRGL